MSLSKCESDEFAKSQATAPRASRTRATASWLLEPAALSRVARLRQSEFANESATADDRLARSPERHLVTADCCYLERAVAPDADSSVPVSLLPSLRLRPGADEYSRNWIRTIEPGR